MNLVDFIHLFSEFLTKISSILIKFNKIFHESDVDFTFQDKIHCRLFSLNSFCLKFRLKISKNSDFHQKQHEISFFSPF